MAKTLLVSACEVQKGAAAAEGFRRQVIRWCFSVSSLSLEALGTLLQLLPIKAWKVSVEAYVWHMSGTYLANLWLLFIVSWSVEKLTFCGSQLGNIRAGRAGRSSHLRLPELQVN